MNKVVARFIDGRLVKGTSVDVDPAKPVCHVSTPTGMVEVALADLKAVFFVKDLQGNPGHREGHAPSPGDLRTRGARLIQLRFTDGEQLSGLVTSYSPARPFFFVLPVDPASNNLRVLVNRAAVATTTLSDLPSAPRA